MTFRTILDYFQSIVTYSFSTCHINILNDVTRELREREENYILREILLGHEIINIET
jgi:hypothetical protein